MKECNLEYKRINAKLQLITLQQLIHELVHEINRFCVCEIKRKKYVLDLKEGPSML